MASGPFVYALPRRSQPRQGEELMSTNCPRVAFFTDNFHEVNGIALTSRHLIAYARKNDFPFLAVYCTDDAAHTEDEHPLALPLRRGRLTISVERDFVFDILFWRYAARVREALRSFRPDVIHVTSPGDIGLLGTRLAMQMRIPLVASWHTNLHEFAGRRLSKLLRIMPEMIRSSASQTAERGVLYIAQRFYKIARILMAPNPELAEMLEASTGKPTYIMLRGVNTNLFSASKRTANDGVFRLGFVGRISPEKNVRFLVQVEKALLAERRSGFRFVVVGNGSELGWLKSNLIHADFPGVLRGEALAEAYANMDAFVFPSQTDTFGNVILEAQASGVPVLVTPQGGPKFLVQHGISGFIARDQSDFVRGILSLMDDLPRRVAMGRTARSHAEERSWDRVFEDVFKVYKLAASEPRHGMRGILPQRSHLVSWLAY